MTAQIMAPTSRNRLPLLFIFFIPFGGMALAAWMYFSGQLIPDGRNHQGNLLWPPKAVAEFNWVTPAGNPLVALELDEQWGLAVVSSQQCAAECKETLYRTRQAHIALGRRAERLSRYVVLPAPSSVELNTWLEQEHKGTETLIGSMPFLDDYPEDSVRVFVIDPLGNVMLWFNKDHNGKQILKDLEKLIRNSRIG